MANEGSDVQSSVRGAGQGIHRIAGCIRTDRRQLATWDTLRWVVAFVLFAAAGLKTHELATGPAAGSGLLASRGFLTGVVHIELLLAVWLVSGLWKRAAWGAALGAFSLFALVSLASVVSGAESCGCFGRVRLHPGYTLALDVVLVAALWRARPGREGRDPALPWRRLQMAGAGWLCLAGPMTWAVMSFSPDRLSGEGRILGTSGLVIFDPQEWVGQAFPLTEHIELEADLLTGEWLVVLHQHSCSDCTALLPHAVAWAEQAHREGGATRVAFLEVPPLGQWGELHVSPEEAFASGKLSEAVDWFVRTPAVLRLVDGQVVAIKDHDALFLEDEPIE